MQLFGGSQGGGVAGLAEVAAAAGVSVATASRVLSGSSQKVSAALRQRVLDAAADLHYVPNAHAQALVRATTSTVGLIVHDGSDPYFSEITRGVFQAAQSHGRLVLICNTYRVREAEDDYISVLRAQRVQAILLAGSGFTDERPDSRGTAELQAFESSGGRVVLVGRHRGPFDSVLPDNAGGARLMIDHLTGLGHTRIGIIAGPANLTTIEDRLTSAREALADRALDAQVVHEEFHRDGGYAGALRLLDADAGVTAIFALNDTMAVGALVALRERGLRVPQDVAVAGFDDIPMVRDVTPPVTTIRLPMEDMGRVALELALRDRAKKPRRQPMAAELVVRASTVG